MIISRLIVSAFGLAISTIAAQAHEYWIDPADYTVAPGEPVVAELRVGEMFEGTSFAYFPNQYRSFDLSLGGAPVEVASRMGDRPALSQPFTEEGLLAVSVVTRDSTLTYTEFEKFEDFVRHKAALWTLDAHRARGLPDTGFVEGYSRYAKSLIAVGSGAGADTELGLETEIIALANPYTDDLSGGLPVRVAYKGAPRAGEQLEIYDRAPDGTVTVSTLTTDANGEARVPVTPGHAYMLDSVVLREPEGDLADRPDVVWESLWANLTFAVPEAD